jgi:hypothetical protein
MISVKVASWREDRENSHCALGQRLDALCIEEFLLHRGISFWKIGSLRRRHDVSKKRSEEKIERRLSVLKQEIDRARIEDLLCGKDGTVSKKAMISVKVSSRS